jgi:AraC family transcriptional regulator, transcriptional activator of pobA
MARAALRRIPAYFLYGEQRQDVPQRYLHVETIQARSARHHWKIGPHLHPLLHQVVLVSQGRGIARIEDSRLPFEPPALTFAPAGAVHGYDFEPGTVGFVITFAQGILEELRQRDPAVGQLFAAPHTLELPPHASATAVLQDAQRLAAEHAQGGAGRALALEGWLALLLAHALRLSQAQGPWPGTSQPRSRQLVTRFRALLESRLSSGLSVPQYAQALQVSEAQLRNACLAATGQPPVQIIHARLLLEAKRQLAYTALPVREIAYALGFEDAAYFTRFFTRRAGVSPRSYRARRLQT